MRKMEWIQTILAKHVKEDGTIDLEAANKEIDKEFPDHAVPKDQYNNISSQLSESKKTLKTLEEKTKDNPDVQKELSSLKEKAEALEKENTDLKINSQVSAVLQASGAKDIDYALFKLGKLELDKDGKVKDLDSKVKELKSSIPDYFAKEDDKKETTPPAGYQTIDTKLLNGQQQTTFSLEELNNMTPAQINENWEAVSASLEGGNE